MKQTTINIKEEQIWKLKQIMVKRKIKKMHELIEHFIEMDEKYPIRIERTRVVEVESERKT